jgi:hypothetical protein
MFLATKNSLHTQSSVRRRIVLVKHPVLVPSSFRTFSADLLSQTLQELQVVMLVHRLGWRNNALTVKKDHQHALDVRPTFESIEQLKSLFSPWHCHRKLFLAFRAFPMHFSRV